ncbi:MAG: patatin-like phospholipase family protein [Alphaproteobacteria bacterium]
MPTPRIGLALGGGAARGWAHLGVLEALQDLGIRPDVICGSSIGALVGGVYLSGYMKELETWASKLTRLRMARYLDVKITGKGLLGGDRLYTELEQHLGETRIEDLSTSFVCVTTDLQTGEEVWLRNGRLVDAIRAAFAIPGVFEPVMLDGRWLVDGAIVNPVPVSVCRALGAQIVVAVRVDSGGAANMTMTTEANSKAAGFSSSTLWPGRQKRARRRFNGGDEDGAGAPNLLSVMMSTINIVQARVIRARLIADPPDVTIGARAGHIGLLEFHRAPELIRIGRAAVARAEDELLDVIAAYRAATTEAQETAALSPIEDASTH